jgi:hypothetical protein
MKLGKLSSAMTHLASPSPQGKSNVDSSGERDLLLSALRAATARPRLAANEFDTIGISLRQKLITCEQALEWARNEGLIGWVRLGPEVQQ